jgi:hypothetical protein
MRKVINKATAIRAVVLLFALIGILLIFPVRAFTGVLTVAENGESAGSSDHVNYEHVGPMQEFTAQYDRLSSVDVYITEMEKGRYVESMLFDEMGRMILRAYTDTEGIEFPGFLSIPMEIDLEVGKTYALKFAACRSKYYLGYERATGEDPYVGTLTRYYRPVDGVHLKARYNYRLPLSKSRSLVIIAIIAAVAAAIYALTGLYYKKNPEKNSLITVGTAVKWTANPVAALVFGCLMIMVFPLRLFDFRVADIIFYEIGLIISAAIVFYAINHKAVKHEIGISFWQNLVNQDKLRYILIMFAMAMAIWYGSVYMNDLYDIYHTISERHMAIWLLVMMVLTFSFTEAFNLYNLVWVLGSGIFGIYYYNSHKLLEGEKEYDLNNTILKCGIIIVILGGLVVLNLIRVILQAIKQKRYGHGESECVKPSVFGILLFIFFVAIVILNNTRTWSIYLALTYTVFYIRLAAWGKKKDYYKILSGGLMMNFAISMVYCWLHRYFVGYVSGRFGFLFHTVTVTAEYLTFMGAVATVLLAIKLVSLPKKVCLKDIVVSAWKEMVLFGFIMSYAIFTVSRTAYLAIIMSTLLVMIMIVLCHKKQLGRMVGVFALSLILCFPAAFTLQRIIPTMVAQPVFYDIDDADEFVRGGANWGNTNFMCVERFVNLFKEKMLGMDVGSYEYPIDRYNYDQETGTPIYDEYGRPYDEDDYGYAEPKTTDGPVLAETKVIEEPLLAAINVTGAEVQILREEMAEYVDEDNILDVLSNGRMTIFKAYLSDLNMWGHDEMGTLLPNGEIAVHAHNTYLQVAFDRGIPVGILFVIVLFAGLISGIRYYKKNQKTEPLSLVTPAIVIGFMVAGLSEWVFQYCNPMTIALMLAIAPITFKVTENEN